MHLWLQVWHLEVIEAEGSLEKGSQFSLSHIVHSSPKPIVF